jgi:hypothetical protein
MNKFTIIAIIATVAILVGGVFLVSKNSTPKVYPNPTNLTLYFGTGCPHCKIVDEFLSSWSKKDTVKIDQKEVWSNAGNAAEMQARYTSCNVPLNEMGVPLLFTPDGKCFSGDTPIINYLKSL